jgi:hypothetical protein
VSEIARKNNTLFLKLLKMHPLFTAQKMDIDKTKNRAQTLMSILSKGIVFRTASSLPSTSRLK